MIHPLDFNPDKALQVLLAMETVATVANTIAPETVVAERFSNNRNFSRDDAGENLVELEKELSLKRYLYEACVHFERKPFHRQLSPDCIAAGHEAIQRLRVEIEHLEKQIDRLKQDNLS